METIKVLNDDAMLADVNGGADLTEEDLARLPGCRFIKEEDGTVIFIFPDGSRMITDPYGNTTVECENRRVYERR